MSNHAEIQNVPFNQLIKNCRKDTDGMKKHKVAVLGDFATQHLAKAIQGYAYEFGYAFDVYDSDYNQIYAQILDSDSEIYAFKPSTVLMAMCSEKLYEKFCATPLEERIHFADNVVNEILMLWGTLNNNIKTNVIQTLFIEADDRSFGNYGLKVESSFIYQVKKINYQLISKCLEYNNITLLDLNTVKFELGNDRFHDEKMYYIAKIPFSQECLSCIAKNVVSIISATDGRIKKCIVLDLDNTLWGGVIGDDGLEGIQIGELGLGHAFADFQNWLKELKNRGIILAVCSKNNEDIAKEPFQKHPEMVLHLDDISMFVANWEDKATNIKHIQKVLNIGMDSIVFLDDNKFERNLVRELVPDITVPELPEDPAQYVSYLKQCNLFETATYSEEDKNRTQQYQAETNRTEMEKQFASFDDYLVGLNMIATAKPFDTYNYPRIAQLSQRSNQFNLRTIRYTEAQIKDIAESDKHLTLYFTLKDKFGDYGLISVVILDKQNKEELFISEWFMSCRVLKRGMEEFIINKVIELADQHGYKKVIGEYIKTEKNKMVETIYEKMGFSRLDNGVFRADVQSFCPNKTFITEE